MLLGITSFALIIVIILMTMFRRCESIIALPVFGVLLFDFMNTQLFGIHHGATFVITLFTMAAALFIFYQQRASGVNLAVMTGLEWLLLAWLAMVWVSWLYAPVSEYGMYKTQKLSLTLIPSVLLARFCFSSPSSARYAAWFLGFFTVLLVPWMILYYWLWYSMAQETSRWGAGAAIVVGNLLATMVLGCIYLIRVYRFTAPVGIPVMIFSVVMLLLTGSRGAVLSTGIIVAGVMLRFRTVFRGLLWTALLIAIVIVAYRFLPQSNIGVQRLTDLNVEETGRPALFTAALEIFARHPIFGAGAGGFAITRTGRIARDYPHNLPLETLSEQGLIGGIPLIIVYGLGFTKFWKIRTYKFSSRKEAKYIEPVLQFANMLFLLGVLMSLYTGDSPMQYLLFLGLGAVWGCAQWLPSKAGLANEKPSISSHRIQ